MEHNSAEYGQLLDEVSSSDSLVQSAITRLSGDFSGISSAPPTARDRAAAALQSARDAVNGSHANTVAAELANAKARVEPFKRTELGRAMKAPLDGASDKIVHYTGKIAEKSGELDRLLALPATSDATLTAKALYLEEQVRKLKDALIGAGTALQRSAEAAKRVSDSWIQHNQARLFETVHADAARAIDAIKLAGRALGGLATFLGQPHIAAGISGACTVAGTAIRLGVRCAEDDETRSQYATLLERTAAHADNEDLVAGMINLLGEGAEAAGLSGASDVASRAAAASRPLVRARDQRANQASVEHSDD